MGQNDSKALPKFKINQRNENIVVKPIGSNQSSSEMENAPVSSFKYERAHFDRERNPDRSSVHVREIFPEETNIDFQGEGEINPFVLKLENQPAPLNKRNLEINTKEPDIFATKQPQKHKFEQQPSSFLTSTPPQQKDIDKSFRFPDFTSPQPKGMKGENQSIPFSATQPEGQQDEQPVPVLTTQAKDINHPFIFPASKPQEKKYENEHNIFTEIQSQSHKDANQPFLSSTTQPPRQKDNNKSFRFPDFMSTQPKGMKGENRSIPFSATQPEGQKDNQPVPVLTTQAKDVNHPFLFPASKLQEKKYENEHNIFTEIQLQSHKDANQPFLSSTTQLQQGQNNDLQYVPFTSSQPLGKKDENQPVLYPTNQTKGQTSETQQAAFPMSQPQVRIHDKQPDIFSNAELKEQKHGNQHVVFATGQPLTQIPNISSLPQKPKESLNPDMLNINQPQNAESIPTKPAMENKPSKKTISSGNPFLQSTTNGMIAKGIFEMNASGQSSVVPPNRTNPFDNVSPTKEAKNSTEKDTLVAPNCDPAKVFNVPSSKSPDNLVLGAVKKKSSGLKVAGRKGSTKDEIIKKTIKHFDMIALSLTSSADTNKPQQESVRTEYTESRNKERDNHLMFHNCIGKMNNICDNDNDFVSSLQTELVTYLKEMARFTSALKTCSVINSDIYSVCETIKENLSILISNYQTNNSCVNVDSSSTCKVELSNTMERQNPTYSLAENHKNGMAHVIHDNRNVLVANDIDGNNLFAKSAVKKEIIMREDENKKNIPPLNPYLALLDQLPNDLIEEKQNISLMNSGLYCRVCEKPIDFVLLNLIQHLRGKNHNALVASVKKSALVSRRDLSHQSDSSSSNKPLSSGPNAGQVLQETEPAVNITLQPHYSGILDLICQSVEGSFDFGLNVYICLLCDHLQNDEAKALNHVKMDHKDLHNTDWHFCIICRIKMFGTDIHFKEHYFTVQHIKIAKLKNGSPLEELSKENCSSDTASVTEEFDRGSVCSSKSDASNKSRPRMKPHEILLAIAKGKKDKNFSGPFGLYCQVCNKYSESSAVCDHLNSKQHTELYAAKTHYRRKQSTLRECSTCEIYLFGDIGVWKEHQNLQTHKELLASAFEGNIKSSEVEDNDQDDLGELSSQHGPPKANYEPSISESSSSEDLETNSSEQLSSLNESGPHYDLMKKVLKKHLDKTSDDVSFGLYCHLCQLYFIDQKQWESHVNSNPHKFRINSSEFLGRKIRHDCGVCNVQLVCDEKFFSLHLQSVAHKAISRIPSRQMFEQAESEDDSSEDEDTSSENDNECEKDILGPNDNKKGNSNNITGREGRTNNAKRVPNGIYFKGFPKDVGNQTIAECFRKFGPLKSFNVDKRAGSGKLVFQKKSDATMVLQKKTVFINKTPVILRPLVETRSGVQERCRLHPDMVRVMSSWPDMASSVARLLSEMSRNYSFNQPKGLEINQDLSAVVPGCRVIFFGSQVTGLATGRSDFDIYIDFDGKSFYKDLSIEQQQRIIQHLNYHLNKRGSKFLVKDVILEARVPIIRVEHIRTKTLCDISCRSGLSVENSQLVRMYLEYDRRVRWLVVAVKYWMDANGLLDRNAFTFYATVWLVLMYLEYDRRVRWLVVAVKYWMDANGLLDRTAFTSYATVWLVLYFLMRLPNPVICPLVTLQTDCNPHTVAKWDCRFHRDMRDVYRFFTTSNRQSELVLLSLFFQTYANLPYKLMVLCPLNGQLLERKQFEILRLPREFSPYMDKMQFTQGAERLKIQTPICLQDPFDLSHNITKGVSRPDLMKFKKLCNQSFKMCQHLLARNVN